MVTVETIRLRTPPRQTERHPVATAGTGWNNVLDDRDRRQCSAALGADSRSLHSDLRYRRGRNRALDRLHESGYIHDPVSKAKSVMLTEEGAQRSKRLFEKHFMTE